MVNLSWLQTFCTLVETGHFTRTAEKLAMTQPGVSQQIRKLEQHFGQNLLQREGKRFRLTDAGEQVYRQGRQSLAQLSQLEQSLATDDPYQGHCRLASPGSLGLKLYPLLLEQLVSHPGLSLDYRFAPNDGIERDLSERRLDLALMTRPSALAELRCEPFASEQLLLVTPSHCHEVDWPTLQSLGFVGHPDGEHHARLLLGANFPQFEQDDPLPLRAFSNNIGTILAPVARGLGFTVLPANAVQAFAPQSALRIHPLPNPVEETVYRVQRRYQALPKRFELLLETMAGALMPAQHPI
ncbi:LysR family transcriptional regulator [Ferrimonas marina]|uniref:DNA-binding transcriptional regulator, LysR family n=1 Tax=Ferrimonas marina TaxID=299255 RepID=A0A1M5MFJ3_9GAMM|nr:LysR family transcriptional regulator [Ferrimonas marina]SHG76016.1 DNA-binding transcriptional regulator, LysR family [Ferrimonas marina]